MQLCLTFRAKRLLTRGGLCTECCCDDWIQVVHVERVFAKKLAATCSMAFLVAGAKILANERPTESARVVNRWIEVEYLWQSGKSQL